ncbi:MAG: BREX system P-loop protein BrxC, partial [Polyangiaceae bacterium]|nr:BREX system P-loop protein BrxC [Polyangiaceae bacterium]
MKIKDILARDPSSHPLVNHGQARIGEDRDQRMWNELQAELSTFVCEGQFADGTIRILSSFLTCLSQTSQKAAWVSGYYGSGKSHLLKMLCHIWTDTALPDGSTARGIIPALPEELHTLLRNLDTAGNRSGGLFAAAGSLPSGDSRVRATILSVILRGAGLPGHHVQAEFCLWLYDQGWLERVKDHVLRTGQQWQYVLNSMYVSNELATAVRTCDPSFASSDIEGRRTFQTQFPPLSSDITTDHFLTTAKRALRFAGRDGQVPLTMLVLDEVQQYIGDSNERSTTVTETTEALCKQFDGRLFVVGAGQSALSADPMLNKLMDRYAVRVQLSGQDVAAVVRKVVLRKKASALANTKEFLDIHGGEVSRQLRGTRLAETAEDRHLAVYDYPMVPARRQFWERCIAALDSAGTQNQLRSQLRIVHDVIARYSDRDIGFIVPADELFDALAPELVNTGTLPRETNERINALSKDGSEKAVLAHRV